jgi:hypothetical protein
MYGLRHKVPEGVQFPQTGVTMAIEGIPSCSHHGQQLVNNGAKDRNLLFGKPIYHHDEPPYELILYRLK